MHKVTLKSVLPMILLCSIACKNSADSPVMERKTYQEKVLSLKEEEQREPSKFLTADGTYKENFFGDKYKIDCTITNSAAAAAFKDAVLLITYYSKTKTVLGTEKVTVYENFPPKSRKTVKLKVNALQNVSSIGWDVISATPL